MITTEILNHFDLPSELTGITGTFRYRFFEPLEKTEENSRFANNNEEVPRYTLVDWTGQNDPLPIAMQGQDLVHRENLFFPSDLNSGFTSLATSEEETAEVQSHIVSDNTSVASKLEYLLETVASDNFTEKLEENIQSSRSVIPVLDPTTNTPVVGKSAIKSPNQPADILVRSANLYSIVQKSSDSPLAAGVYDELISSSKTISKKSLKELEERNNARLMTTFASSVQQLGMPDSNGQIPTSLFTISRDNANASLLEDWQLVGYFMSKYKVENGHAKYMYSRVLYQKSYEDPYIAYGKTYRYEIRPIFCKYVMPSSNRVIFLASDESSYIDIECVEKRAPSPPRNLRFEYIGDENIDITWERPESRVNDKNRSFDTNDIKGYQLFYRHSLREPYQLFRYFTFNNTFPQKYKQRAAEIISDDLIISSEHSPAGKLDPNNLPSFYEFKNYVFKIRPNTDYYFAMCSIDAHGNSSNYSVQYRIRRNNVTGEVDIQILSVEGAPKQYPNMLIQGKLVDSSMKTSGFQFLDIYFAPDTIISTPNRNQPATNLQIFDLETQVQKNITITINDT